MTMSPDEDAAQRVPGAVPAESVPDAHETAVKPASEPTLAGQESISVPAQETSEHIFTADRVALLGWGDGSAPSLPSIDDGSNADSDHDSVMGSVRTSSTGSVTSSVYHFVEENGRTYHKYKEGRYHLPNDEEEQERLDLQHAAFLVTTGGELFLAPLEETPKKVMDIATGTGIWAIEFAQLFPESQVVGTDLSPIQPSYIPPNCKFEIDDAEDQWPTSAKYDFIHGRALISCFSDPAFVIRQAYDALEPGGYLEYQDGKFPMEYIGEPPTDSHIYKWNQMIVEATTKLGRNWACSLNYKRWFEEAGFENVVERRFYWPSGPWAKGKYYKNISAYSREDLLRGVEPLSIKLFGVLGWTADQTKAFLEDVRKDILNTKIRTFVPVIFVWGRKPGKKSQEGGKPTHEAQPTAT